MKRPAIRTRDLGKRFSKAPGMSLDFTGKKKRDRGFFWAIEDLSLEIDAGDAVGIIGRNGAGKTTLLKILSRIIPPTTGFAEIYGRVNSLLEVGTGFQPDLSGSANIFLNASILGMTRSETERCYDEIVGFSGLGEFIEMPVKYYSSGMYSRLAFAVAAYITGDILLVDEVLAVGDAEFRQKCLSRMTDLMSAEKRTVLFVSHSMDAILRFCNKVLWLERGRLQNYGPAEAVIREYMRSVNNTSSAFKNTPAGPRCDSYSPDCATVAERRIVGGTAAAAAPLQVGESVTKNGRAGNGPVESSWAEFDVTAQSTQRDAGFEPSAVITGIRIDGCDGERGDIVFREEPLRIVLECDVRDTSYRIYPVIHLHCMPRPGIPSETHVLTSLGGPSLLATVGTVSVSATLPDRFLATGKYAISAALVTLASPIMRHYKVDHAIWFCVLERGRDDEPLTGDRLHGVVHPKLDWAAVPPSSNDGTIS